jgi:hypothetical protein
MSISVIIIRDPDDDDDRDGHRNVGTLRTPNVADSPRRLHQDLESLKADHLLDSITINVFGPKKETGWTKLHNEKFHNLYSSHIIKAIKSRIRWVVCVA